MWTPSALASEAKQYSASVIRIVEGQHIISTRRLADTLEDQALLEALAEEVKPRLPEAARHLPWLLASPFRYGYGRPSRFRPADSWPGIFYASEAIETAVTEAVYWRLLAFSRSPGFKWPNTVTQMSAFSVHVAAARMIDLSAPPFDKDEALWTHAEDYTATQAIAAQARAAKMQMIRSRSARHEGGINISLFDPACLRPPHDSHSSWAFVATGDGLLASQELGGMVLRFTAAQLGLA